MASSMNGLSVEDSAADNKMVSPARLENAPCFRDETIIQYSPTSEDLSSYDIQVNTSRDQTDTSSPSTSAISSPNRFHKPNTCPSSGNPYPLPSCSRSAVASTNVGRRTEHESRIPCSPNDMCHGGDLRRTALLRSVQMRVQPPQPIDSLFGTEHDLEQELAHGHADEFERKDEKLGVVELEHRSCPRLVQDAAFG